ncbi:MAG TPA: FtsX-like permease family protein [Rhodanobacteraceae bacterium]
MQVRPILATLNHHKLTTLLLMLQVAFTCAIVCNVVFMIAQRVALTSAPSGVAENELAMIENFDLQESGDLIARHTADLAALRAIPGVKAAAAVDALPFNGNDWGNGIATVAQGPSRLVATAFDGSPGELDALGLHLLAGRDFLPEEYISVDSAHGYAGIDHVPAAIVTRALAERLFPGQSPLGKPIYPGNSPARIVGVVDHLQRPSVSTGGDNEYSTLFPMRLDTRDVEYVLRTGPGQRQRALRDAAAVLDRLDGNRILRNPQTFEQLRADYFRRDRTMIGLLIASALGLLFVTALGITGLASFWVQQRTRTIGVRRALGATRGDILTYFQTENFLIVTFGIVPGTILAVAINLTLMKFYELPHLPFFYLPIGALALWMLGQLAVLHPALRAAAVPPVVATRTV